MIVKNIICCAFGAMSVLPGIAQKCWFTEWGGRPPLVLGQDDNYRTIYNQIMADTSDTWNILLLELGGFKNQREGFFLKYSTGDSIYYSKDILRENLERMNDSLYTNRIAVLFKQIGDINGFYAGDCYDYVSSNSSEFLIIKNGHLDKWIEVYSGRGSLKEVLFSKEKYAWLLNVCNYVKDVKAK